MSDEEMDTTTPPEDQEKRNESGESGGDDNNEDGDDDNGGEKESGANGEPSASSSSKSKKRKSKSRKSKKSKPSDRDYLPDPYTHCESNGTAKPEEEEEKGTGHMDKCRICQEGEFLLLCETCTSAYHAFCLNPPLDELPPLEEWRCPRCSVVEPKNRPEKILSWRWIEVKYPDPVAPEDAPKEGEKEEELEEERRARLMLLPRRKMDPRKERELFIKWKHMSYWHCEWVNELVLELYFPGTLSMYWRKMNPETPPEVDGGSFGNTETGQIEGKEKEKDPHNLEERYYRYGIKPEWMQVHRIIDQVQNGNKQFEYLVKWKEPVYAQATWVRDDFDIPGFEESVFRYRLYRAVINRPLSSEAKMSDEQTDTTTPPEDQEERNESGESGGDDSDENSDSDDSSEQILEEQPAEEEREKEERRVQRTARRSEAAAKKATASATLSSSSGSVIPGP